MLGREFFAQLSQHFYGPTFLRFNFFTSQYFYNYGIYFDGMHERRKKKT